MATPFALNDVIVMKMFCNTPNQQAINSVGYQVSALVGAITDQQFADAFSTAVAVPYKNFLNVNAAYAGVKAQIIRPTLRVAVISRNGAGAGTVGGDMLPSQTSFLLSPRTAVAGRKGRGRTYLPFWSESANDAGGHPTAGAIGFATAWSGVVFAAQTIVVGANSANLTPVIVSRTGILTNIPVTNVVVRVEWATQRRRSQINKPDVLGP